MFKNTITKKLTVTERESAIVYSDASAVGAGAFTVGVDEKCSHQMWNENEMRVRQGEK